MVLDRVVAEFDSLMSRIGARFTRSEPRARAGEYVSGLVAGLERKNGWTVAEHAGEAGPQGMQRLLRKADWDVEGVRDDVRDYVIEHLGDPEAVLAADETGFLKKGVKSAGVQRQYSGTAGRTENCQIGVFLAYASTHGHALIDRELYLPQSWTGDRDRCRGAGIPDEVEFATKPRQVIAMLERILAAGVPFRWFTADEAYGQAGYLRDWLEERDVFYVMATRCDQQITTRADRSARADALVAEFKASTWQRLSVGAGAHGPREFDWARRQIEGTWAGGRGHWLLARRSISNPTEIAYYLCYGPASARLVDLAFTAGSRWHIEEAFQQAKGEAGLDHYQVRSWRAWYAHITLSMLALAWLAASKAIAAKGTRRPRRRHDRADTTGDPPTTRRTRPHPPP
ncbi:IS701 family transposase [Nocardia sp. CA-128927]|uniref:IS701 family transposase n=1 Tax=Nocardia sp. CA-128927 TaxID=3239975 RepID=UPI003D95D5C9